MNAKRGVRECLATCNLFFQLFCVSNTFRSTMNVFLMSNIIKRAFFMLVADYLVLPTTTCSTYLHTYLHHLIPIKPFCEPSGLVGGGRDDSHQDRNVPS